MIIMTIMMMMLIARVIMTTIAIMMVMTMMCDPKIFFNSTKNLVSNSPWVGGHRYTRILLVSKLLWE